MRKLTLGVIKADVGSVGGHIRPSRAMLERVRDRAAACKGSLPIDAHVGSTGDDIALLVTHRHDRGNSDVRAFAWNVFPEATGIAREQGLYGSGQDLLRDAFSGNVRGMGPAVAEPEIEERPAEPFLFFAADRTDPGAFNLPLYPAFADPMNTPGLILSPELSRRFRFVIMDVAHTGGDRMIELQAPAQLYEIAALLRDPERYVIESVVSVATGAPAVSACTTRLHDIAGKYTGKDDPIMLVRVQKGFPATGEVLAPYALAPLVAGGMRGSHYLPLMPVPLECGVSYFDGPPIVSCAAFCVHDGKLTEPRNVFAHPFWNRVRERVADKAVDLRRQGFFGAAMPPMAELEYTGITAILDRLQSSFALRPDPSALH